MPRPIKGKRTVSSTNSFGVTNTHLQKNEVGPLPNIISISIYHIYKDLIENMEEKHIE
jgi:hypothetical protein